MIVTAATQRPRVARRIAVSGYGQGVPEHEAGQSACGALDCWMYAVYGLGGGLLVGVVGALITRLIVNRKEKAA